MSNITITEHPNTDITIDALPARLRKWYEKGKSLLEERKQAQIEVNKVDWKLVAWLEEAETHGEEAYTLMETLGIDYTRYRRLYRFARIPAPLRRASISMSHYEVLLPFVEPDGANEPLEKILDAIEKNDLSRDALRQMLRQIENKKIESENGQDADKIKAEAKLQRIIAALNALWDDWPFYREQVAYAIKDFINSRFK